VTLSNEKLFDLKDPKKMAKLLREDKNHVRATYERYKEMIERSRLILKKLDDRFLFQLLDVTEMRLDKYFRNEVKVT
jgi:hypothetical protein